MIEWKSIEKLTYKILYTEYHDYDLALLGEAYLAFDKAKNGFDPEKNPNFLTYYAACLRGHLNTYKQYNSELIHIPLLKRKENHHNYKSIHEKIGDSETTIGYLLQSTDDIVTDISYNDIRDCIKNKIKFTKGEEECVPFILSGDEFPRRLRTMMRRTRTKIAEHLVSIGY